MRGVTDGVRLPFDRLRTCFVADSLAKTEFEATAPYLVDALCRSVEVVPALTA